MPRAAPSPPRSCRAWTRTPTAMCSSPASARSVMPSPISSRDRKSTRLNSSHTVIYTLSLHDALPIFDSSRFIADVEGVLARLGRCQIAVSEGVQDAQGRPIATTLVQGLDKDAHGNVQLSGVGALGDALADLIK